MSARVSAGSSTGEQVTRESNGFEIVELDIRNRKPITRRHLERMIRDPISARFGQLSRFIRRWQPDVVSSHTFNWDTFPTIAAA
ncbi:MAG TPA: hypothetical protein VIX12_07735, partial [Candidatus Binataceae bacterium]